MAISAASVGLALGLLLAAAALGYAVTALGVVAAWRGAAPVSATPRPAHAPAHPAVSVLKPLAGLEPELAANLRSFCDQDYPHFEVILGVGDGSDAGLATARQIAAEFPDGVRLVVGDHLAGPNRKVANLTNMMAAARHDWIVVADSDVRVPRDYLSRLVDPLGDPTVGVVTCLYRARPLGTAWSVLGALAVNDWFIPSVLVSGALGSQRFVSGATLALRRDALEAVGGFAPLASHLADDYELGRRTRARGLRTVLSPVLVETLVYEPSARALVAHDVRWLCTIRGVAPWGYLGLAVTQTLVACLLAAWLVGAHPWALVLPAVALALRLMLHFTVQRRLGVPGAGLGTALLVPLRDLLGFAEWVAGFFTRRVRWREQQLAVAPHGRIRIVTESSQ
jgi:ceramide glucosyltransferase